MNPVRVIDARMGRGKTSAAINYILDNKSTKKFMFITPYLKEVERICTNCGFVQPDDTETSKSTSLKRLMHQGENIAMTHALFYLMDVSALDLARENNYALIIDEVLEPVNKLSISSFDLDLILRQCDRDETTGRLMWRDKSYSGIFNDFKQFSEQGNLFNVDTALFWMLNPDIFSAFSEVTLMTYLFNGQYLRCYFDMFKIDYKICGVDASDGFRFSESLDAPPPVDLHDLITIADNVKSIEIGNSRHALSKTWYERRGMDNPDIKKLRASMEYFLRGNIRGKRLPADKNLWTTFKNCEAKLEGRRYKSSFVQLNEKATNEYKERNRVAYMVNRFTDPNMKKFYAQFGVSVDDDQLALSEMLQFIWRSAIRDGQHIDLYIPSRRMRELLINWINEMNNMKG